MGAAEITIYTQDYSSVMHMKKVLFITLVIILIGLHIVLLPFSPPGFFVDEAATGAHVVSMIAHGTNAHGESWPLFSASLGGGYTTPIYLYPLSAWAAIFGTSELALRSFSVTMTLLSILLIGYTVRLWLGVRAGATATIVGLILPWAWVQGSLAWDPALVPLLTALTAWAFSILYLTESPSRWRVVGHIVLPFSLVGLAYLYPPMRVSAPLLFIGAYGLLWYRRFISLRTVIIACVVAAVISLPLAQFILQPDALERSRELSVFHDTSIIGGIWQTFCNFGAMLNPVFLFVTGDPNLRHATGIQGMLGVAALLPFIVLIARFANQWRTKRSIPQTHRTLLTVATFGVITCLLGSALTNEGQPHSLRATAAWVFFVILITLGWHYIATYKRRSLFYGSLVIAVIATLFYIGDFYIGYPHRSANSFDVPERTIITSGHTITDYPSMAQQYYRER